MLRPVVKNEVQDAAGMDTAIGENEGIAKGFE
jgi:hypothetical protein